MEQEADSATVQEPEQGLEADLNLEAGWEAAETVMLQLSLNLEAC